MMVKQEHLTYLDELRESGETNMFGAGAYLVQQFPEMSKDESRKILSYWMNNFSNEGTKLVETK